MFGRYVLDRIKLAQLWVIMSVLDRGGQTYGHKKTTTCAEVFCPSSLQKLPTRLVLQEKHTSNSHWLFCVREKLCGPTGHPPVITNKQTKTQTGLTGFLK